MGGGDKVECNTDGSGDVCIQHSISMLATNPTGSPAPATGTLGITMRLYTPKTAVLYGRWAPRRSIKSKTPLTHFRSSRARCKEKSRAQIHSSDGGRVHRAFSIAWNR